jgi:dynactin 1
LQEDNGPYDNLRNSVKQINASFAKLATSLESGEFESRLSEDEFKIKKYQVNCPIVKCAEDYKNSLIEAENIKYKLEAKEEEIRELKRNLKLKVDELSEQKLRISLIEKKNETHIKEFDEKNKQLAKTIEGLKEELQKKEK